ncbi:MAG: hypothetical protein EZS28_009034 [Streblomastix strix]|uniref:Uncharacterized protein n=1 Tax=Streblomastix strix TaxID=222440 RepID=A0A5J4WK60_9EUKA|nr:MAG: hypothetical protein EZS28_009034 [Streblomastix strix]
MKQSINAAKVIQGKWKRHKLYEQLQQTLINQRYKRLGEKLFRVLKCLEVKLVTSFALYPDVVETKSRISDAIKLFLQYHDINPSQRLNKVNKQLLEQYNGFNSVTDLERFQQVFKLNVISYTCDEMKYKTKNTDVEQFNKFDEHIVDKDYLTVNVLLVPLSLVGEIHAMYSMVKIKISSSDIFTMLYIVDIDNVINGKLCPLNCQMIFNTKNQNYKRDLARHLKYYQRPQTAKQDKLDHLPKPYYLHISNNKLLQKLVATGGWQELLTPTLNCITFDFETIENIFNVDNVFAQLEPLSVASAETIKEQITALYFDLRDGTDIIEQWINQLFEVAIKFNEANLSNIPDISIDDKNYKSYKPQISVIGFNSKKFDMIPLLKHLIKNRTKIQYMGSTAHAKQTIISHQDYDFDLRFIYISSFIPPNNTLKQFFEKFVLSQSETFTKDDFYDKLNNKNISDEGYKQCEEKVDMFGCILLAQIASQIKYKYCYDIFDINASYNIVNRFEQFDVTQYWWNNKLKGNINQDEYAKRDTSNNVKEDDIDWIKDKVTGETCHLCHNKFTKENKSTLDRIDNSIDSIALFDRHLGFESFTCIIMNKRQEATSQHNDTKPLYYKQILNSAFGGEGQNNAKFDKLSFNDARYASIKQLNLCHKATKKLSDNIYNSDSEVIEEAQYMVSESPRQFKYNKPLQEAVHFCNMETDSMYLAIAGSQIEEWLPWNDCTVAEEKKLMGIIRR